MKLLDPKFIYIASWHYGTLGLGTNKCHLSNKRANNLRNMDFFRKQLSPTTGEELLQHLLRAAHEIELQII
jgi:hypothetical protein